MNTFGEFLYELRKEKGMTQAQLAEILGVTNKAVSKWETGEAMPETGLLFKISRQFGVSVDELLDGKRADDGNGCDETDEEERGGGSDANCDTPKENLFTRGKDEVKTYLDKVGGAVCATLFLLGLAAYLIIGGVYGLWHPYWVIVPVCALSCGIVGVLFDICDGKKRAFKLAHGENPYTGAICGTVMLLCIIAYLLCGALFGLWHPHWIIVAAGAVFCGIVGAFGALIRHRKGK